MAEVVDPNALKDELHASWLAYLDLITPIRPDLYAYCLRCLVDAGVGDMAKVEEVELHIGRLRDAWDQSIAELRRANASATGAA